MPDLSASALVFVAIRGRVWVARIGGGVFLLFAVGMDLLALLVHELDAVAIGLLTILSLPMWAFGLWMLYFASNFACLRATVQEEGLQVVGLTGRRIWPFRAVPRREAFIPWSSVQGLLATSVPNPTAPGNAERTYILYSAQGDFHFTNLHWVDVDRLMDEISRRSGRALDTVAPARQPDATRLRASVKRERQFLRAVGWVCVILASLFALAVVAMLGEGDYVVAGKVGMIAAMLFSMGIVLVRRKS